MKLKRRNSFPMYPCYFHDKENRIIGLPIYIQESILKPDQLKTNINQSNNIFTVNSRGEIKPLETNNDIMDVRLDPNYNSSAKLYIKKKVYEKTNNDFFKKNDNWRNDNVNTKRYVPKNSLEYI